jgi:hypothetical protein
MDNIHSNIKGMHRHQLENEQVNKENSKDEYYEVEKVLKKRFENGKVSIHLV